MCIEFCIACLRSGCAWSLPKNSKPRSVYMSKQLAVSLKGVVKDHKKTCLQQGHPFNEATLLFPGKEGGFLPGTSLNRILKQAIIKTNDKLQETAGEKEPVNLIPEALRFHDIRHTFGSLLINDGTPLIYVCRQMGHSSIQITADIYGHLFQDSYTEHIDALESMHQSAPHTHPPKQERP